MSRHRRICTIPSSQPWLPRLLSTMRPIVWSASTFKLKRSVTLMLGPRQLQFVIWATDFRQMKLYLSFRPEARGRISGSCKFLKLQSGMGISIDMLRALSLSKWPPLRYFYCTDGIVCATLRGGRVDLHAAAFGQDGKIPINQLVVVLWRSFAWALERLYHGG